MAPGSRGLPARGAPPPGVRPGGRREERSDEEESAGVRTGIRRYGRFRTVGGTLPSTSIDEKERLNHRHWDRAAANGGGTAAEVTIDHASETVYLFSRCGRRSSRRVMAASPSIRRVEAAARCGAVTPAPGPIRSAAMVS